MMLCNTIKDLSKIKEDKYIYEPKKDGTRCLVIFDAENGLILFNRKGMNITYRYPEVYESIKISLREYAKKTLTTLISLDGEICCKDFSTLLSREHLIDNFKIKLMAKKYPCCFYAFDVLCLDENVRTLPLMKRKELLDSFKPYQKTGNFEVLPYLNDLNRALELWKNEEGIILKEKNSIYEFEVRSDKWLKFKKRVEKLIRFYKYEINKDRSITLTDNFNRIKCNDLIAKTKIDTYGYIDVEVEGLEFNESGLIRMPILKRIVS